MKQGNRFFALDTHSNRNIKKLTKTKKPVENDPAIPQKTAAEIEAVLARRVSILEEANSAHFSDRSTPKETTPNRNGKNVSFSGLPTLENSFAAGLSNDSLGAEPAPVTRNRRRQPTPAEAALAEEAFNAFFGRTL